MLTSVGRRGELIKIFKKEFIGRGKIIAADNSNTAPALYFADNCYIVPKIYEEDYIEIILEICKKEHIKALLPLIDPEISILAENKNIFSKNNVMALVSKYDTTEICFDKYKTYEFLKNNGIRCIKTYNSLDGFKLDYSSKNIGFPVFIKPNSGSGSVGAKKINTFNQLINTWEKGFIIQEFMSGIEFDADIYVDMISGELVSAFTKRKLSTRIGGADKTISYKDNRLFELIDELVEKLKILGPADIDFFKKNGEYYVSEINPRFGGAYLHAYGCGVNFPKLILNNINGAANRSEVGNFDSEILMMMYDSFVLKKLNDLIV